LKTNVVIQSIDDRSFAQLVEGDNRFT